jgi:tetratricopeptide (TPR) repeat protein
VRLRGPLLVLVLCGAVVFWSNRRLSAGLAWPYPPLTDLVVTEHYAEDIGIILAGARSLAGDISYIQLLQYYGVPENAEAEKHEEETGEFHDIAEGRYPRLLELGTRLLRLDPYFNGPILETAGALAFNQKRVDEATKLLHDGIKLNPHFFRYHLYLAAILFKANGNDEGLIKTLLEAIKYPDCPALFEIILGNLLKKTGRFADAAQVYLHTAETAPQDHDRRDAGRRLEALVRERPEAAAAVQHLLR